MENEKISIKSKQCMGIVARTPFSNFLCATIKASQDYRKNRIKNGRLKSLNKAFRCGVKTYFRELFKV